MFTISTDKTISEKEIGMTKGTNKRYSEAFRQQVVREYEAGSTVSDLQKKYGITGGSTIYVWIKKYAHEGLRTGVVRIQTAEEANRVRELEARVKELERALGKVTLEKLILESALEVIEAEYGIDAKKNVPKSSSEPTAKGKNKPGGK